MEFDEICIILNFPYEVSLFNFSILQIYYVLLVPVEYKCSQYLTKYNAPHQ